MSETVRWRLDISYDGTDFHGWARQDGLRTVQGELESWIGTLLRLAEPVELTVAGRTDAGVHARGQVAHIDLATDVDGIELGRRLRRALPADVIVHDVSRAPDGFDARFAATWRRYCYRIWDLDARPDPLQRGMVTVVRDRLDVARMQAAAARLIGLHDFVAFCKQRDGATTIRELTSLDVHRADGPTGMIEVWVQADAFCHSMVRALVGALVAVGAGRREPAWIDELLASTQRSGAVHVMAAHGLTLESVGYPSDDQLHSRVEQARARREASELNCP